MFIAALEFRKFLQRERSESERQSKLTELAVKWLSKRDCIYAKTTPIEIVEKAIVDSYTNGDDILDPQFFTKEDIIAFAEENGITSDPQVKKFIRLSYVSP